MEFANVSDCIGMIVDLLMHENGREEGTIG